MAWQDLKGDRCCVTDDHEHGMTYEDTRNVVVQSQYGSTGGIRPTITHTRYNSAIHIKISHASIPSTGMNAVVSNLGATQQEQ